jgi:hypothetical protein
MVDTDRERLEISEKMIAAEEEFKRKTDEGTKRLEQPRDLDNES